MRIYPIVEGHGEQEAVPVLLRRLRDEAKAFGVDVGKPIRRRPSVMMRKDDFQNAVRLARIQPDCAAVLVLLDCEDGCPKRLVGQLASWAAEAARDAPSAVVLAFREYETWLLSSVESLRGKCGIAADAVSPMDVESIRGAKERLSRLMPHNRPYRETVDQPRLTAAFDMSLAYTRCRSFRKLVTAVGQIFGALGQQICAWPPSTWKGMPPERQ